MPTNDPTEEEALEDFLVFLLANAMDNPDTDDGGASELREINSLEDAGFMTRDRGVVIRLANGARYTLTIGRAR